MTAAARSAALLRKLDAGAKTQFSATEAAQAITAMGKAGVSVKDILNGGLNGALALAAAGRNRETSTRVSCTKPGCRSELICVTSHTDNLTTTWRCLEHRQITSTTSKGTS